MYMVIGVALGLIVLVVVLSLQIQTQVALLSNRPVTNNAINSDTITRAFQQGLGKGIDVPMVCLFKMYKDIEILDFDSMSGRLVELINEMIDDDSKYDEWYNKMQEYIKEDK